MEVGEEMFTKVELLKREMVVKEWVISIEMLSLIHI